MRWVWLDTMGTPVHHAVFPKKFEQSKVFFLCVLLPALLEQSRSLGAGGCCFLWLHDVHVMHTHKFNGFGWVFPGRGGCWQGIQNVMGLAHSTVWTVIWCLHMLCLQSTDVQGSHLCTVYSDGTVVFPSLPMKGKRLNIAYLHAPQDIATNVSEWTASPWGMYCTHQVQHFHQSKKGTPSGGMMKKWCTSRESNPGLYRGRVLFYH